MSDTIQNEKKAIAQSMLGIFNRKPEDVKMVDENAGGSGNYFNPDSKSAPNQTYRALIKFLPRLDNMDSPNKTETVETVSYWITEGQNKGFRYLSPKSIGKNESCFVADKYWEWKESKDARIKKLASGLSYSRNTIALIQVIKDFVKPENDGKIFYYNVPFSIQKLIKSAMYPTKEDIESGVVEAANDIFNPIEGYSMVMKVPIKATPEGEYRDYDECKFNDKALTTILVNGEKVQRKPPTDPAELAEFQNLVIETILEGPSLKDLEYAPASEATIKRAKNAIAMMEGGKIETEAEVKTEAKAEEKTEAKAEEKTEAKAEEKTEANSEAENDAAKESEDLLASIMGDS